MHDLTAVLTDTYIYSYVEALETRIKDLERAKDDLHQYGTETLAPNVSPTRQIQHTTGEDASALSSLSQTLLHLRRHQSHNQEASLDEANIASDQFDEYADEATANAAGVDAMGTTSTYLIYAGRTEQPGSNYFGPSSTVSFLSLVRHIISRAGSPLISKQMSHEFSDNADGPRSSQGSHRLQNIISKYNTTAFHIPPRREADTLIAYYWTWVHTLYPVLHRPSFDSRYQALWQVSNPSQTTLDDVLFHCRLNAMFALGANFRSELEPPDRRSISESFFSRSEHLLKMELLDFANLEMVQSLVLMAQYLQSTDKPNYCWSIVGLAIRLAQAIGLHLDSPEGVPAGGKIDQINLEVRKRVWASCILLDR